MRRISLAFALTALLLPAVAYANQHRIRPSEVLLSDGGDDAVQFVELLDFYTEGFPNSYYLGVYDADGRSLGSVTLPQPDAPGRVLISTPEADDAFGTNGDAELTVALPPAGQVCFEVLPATKISCLSWGCINTQVTGTGMFPNAEAPAPPDGVSAQFQGTGNEAATVFELAGPTPDAENDSGDAAPACPTDPDAGPSIDAGTDDADASPDGPDGGGSGGDGGDGDDDDSGCGCGVTAGGGAASTLALAAMALLFAFRRRRA